MEVVLFWSMVGMLALPIALAILIQIDIWMHHMD